MQSQNANLDFKTGGRPGKLLKAATRDLAREIDIVINPLGASIASMPVIHALAQEGELPQSKLAEICNVEQPTMAQMLKRMERDGVLVREQDAHDKRSYLFRLSPEFAGIMPKIEAEVDKIYARAFAGVSARDYENFRNVLKIIAENLGDDENLQNA